MFLAVRLQANHQYKRHKRLREAQDYSLRLCHVTCMKAEQAQSAFGTGETMTVNTIHTCNSLLYVHFLGW